MSQESVSEGNARGHNRVGNPRRKKARSKRILKNLAEGPQRESAMIAERVVWRGERTLPRTTRIYIL
eukprot:1397543-Pleurochrysis_carterae.AAC.1